MQTDSETAQHLIQVERLCKSYGQGERAIVALKEVSFEVERGTVFALLGPNGAGKTTLVRLLLNFMRPTGGHASMMGYHVEDKRARQSVGYAPEDLALPNLGNPAQMLEFLAKLSRVNSERVSTRVQQLLEQADLAHFKQSVKKLSKGMKRRLTLAQALVHEPKLLILDEPTDGLDPVERSRVLRLLQDYRDRGGTILLCSHILTEVEQICDHYAILKNGVMMQQGSKQDFTTTGFYVSLRGPIPEEVLAKAPPGCHVEGQDGRTGFVVPDQKVLRALLGVLERSAVKIEEIRGHKTDLKSLFMRIVEGASTRGDETKNG